MNTKRIKITFEPFDIVVRADIDFEQNPEISESIINVLPYRSTVTHAVVSGGNIYHFTPITDKFEFIPKTLLNRIKAPIGTIFLPDPQSFFIKYSDISEQNEYPSIGKVIDKDLDKLIKACGLCWDSIYGQKKVVTIKVEKDDNKYDFVECAEGPIFNSLSSIRNIETSKLISEIISESKRIWLEPSRDLMYIFDGNNTVKPGTNNQYFTTIFFVTSTLQQLSVYGSTTLLAKMSKRDKFDLYHLKSFAKELMPNHMFNFLEYCGLSKYSNIGYKLILVIDQIESREEFCSLLSLFAVYTNQMHLWCLNYFPWQYGKNHEYKLTEVII